MDIKPETYYWAWHEGRQEIIYVAKDNRTGEIGFLVCGQEPMWKMSCLDTERGNRGNGIICEVITPAEAMERFGRCAVLENNLGIRIANLTEALISRDEIPLNEINKIINKHGCDVDPEQNTFWQDCMRAVIYDKDIQIEQLKKQLEETKNK